MTISCPSSELQVVILCLCSLFNLSVIPQTQQNIYARSPDPDHVSAEFRVIKMNYTLNKRKVDDPIDKTGVNYTRHFINLVSFILGPEAFART